jgi:hypothetical protein
MTDQKPRSSLEFFSILPITTLLPGAIQHLIHPAVSLSKLADRAGSLDLSQYPLHGPVPELPEINGSKSRQTLLLDLARREKPHHRRSLSEGDCKP